MLTHLLDQSGDYPGALLYLECALSVRAGVFCEAIPPKGPASLNRGWTKAPTPGDAGCPAREIVPVAAGFLRGGEPL